MKVDEEKGAGRGTERAHARAPETERSGIAGPPRSREGFDRSKAPRGRSLPRGGRVDGFAEGSAKRFRRKGGNVSAGFRTARGAAREALPGEDQDRSFLYPPLRRCGRDLDGDGGGGGGSR